MANIKFIAVSRSLSGILDYVTNREKTVERLISGVNCMAQTAQDEFEAVKKQFRKTDGRSYYHIVQAFAPDDPLDFDTAHEIGLKFAKYFKGYQCVVVTHMNTAHIHNHIIMNSVNFENGQKFHQSAREMQQADSAVTALTGSDAYAEMTRAQRLDAAVAQLQQLAEEGLVSARSLHVDEENGMVSFAYSCGALGGVLVEDPDEENTPFAPSELPAVDLHEMSNAPQGDLGSAMIYYAFDNTVNSSRYPYYSYMKGFWTAMGLHTRSDSTVTVSDLKRMNDYGLCILSAHGSYYTYTSGFLFKQTRTEPVILLTEESDFYKDLYYGIDLLTHRVIKINGLYCITPSFFRAAYRGGQLKDTVVLSETCEFLGVTNSVDESMAEALLAGGARTVLGYVNNVYTVYSRSMLWDTVNHLAMGQTIGRALAHAKDTYGENDIIWYTEQGGRRPHAAAAYLVLYGDENARLNVPENFSLEERAEAAEDMLADVLESAA